MGILSHKCQMNNISIDSKIFLQEYALINKKSKKNHTSASSLSTFNGLFGITPHVCSILWGLLKEEMSHYIKHKHLLWTLYFLRHYPTHHEMSAWCGVSRVTVYKYVWEIIDMISKLPLVSTNGIIFFKFIYSFVSNVLSNIK